MADSPGRASFWQTLMDALATADLRGIAAAVAARVRPLEP